MIEMLSADIQKYEADAARLAKEIAQHDEDISYPSSIKINCVLLSRAYHIMICAEKLKNLR